MRACDKQATHHMPVTIGGGLTFCGRELRPEEFDLIRQITRDFSTLSLTELAHTVCDGCSPLMY
jgi:hypothetical protein